MERSRLQGWVTKSMKSKLQERKIHACSVLSLFCCSIKLLIPPQVHVASCYILWSFHLVPSMCHSRDNAIFNLRSFVKSLKPTITSKVNLSKFAWDIWKFDTWCQKFLLTHDVSHDPTPPRGLMKRLDSGDWVPLWTWSKPHKKQRLNQKNRTKFNQKEWFKQEV
jgi:hypothetical protein